MCLICDRIQQIKKGENPYFVKELETGYVVIGDHQHFKGYTLFLCKEHVTELFHLERPRKVKFLEEMSLTAEAVFRPMCTGISSPGLPGIWTATETKGRGRSGGTLWRKCLTRPQGLLRMNWRRCGKRCARSWTG